MGPTLLTPEERFAALPGYAFEAHYLQDLAGFEGLRIHYLDEPPAGESRGARRTYLCLHGQPTWSYLYRRMIPVFTEAGHRVVAPDLVGFGKSTKPIIEADYSFTMHREVLRALVEQLDLQNVVLVVQDWGGLLGLTLPMLAPERYTGLLVMNTAFGTGDRPLGQGFVDWRAFSNKNPDMAVAKLLSRSCPHLTPAEAAAYDAPFPDASYKAGVRRFPNLVPDHPEADGGAFSRAAREWFRTQWSGQTFMAVGMRDPVLGPSVMREVASHIRGCPAPWEVAEGGHFLQEWGAPVARAALEVFR